MGGNINRINIGCGMTPTKGWRNIDNSFGISIAKWHFLAFLLYKFRLINTLSFNSIKFYQINDIERANACHKIPALNDSIDVIYTSHMLEHLDRHDVKSFLIEAKRVLRSGGILRIVVPDLKLQVNEYLRTNNADNFIEATHLCVPRPKNLVEKLRFLLIGFRHHQWMYDKDSLCNLLIGAGFQKPIVLNPGETTIMNPGSLNLQERKEESLYIEVRKE